MMDTVFRAAVHDVACDAELRAAAAMTATTPARALGLTDVGRLVPGLAADLVVLGPDLHVAAVMADGEFVVNRVSAPGAAAL